MNRLLVLGPLMVLSCKDHCGVGGGEGKIPELGPGVEAIVSVPTLEQDRLTYDKALLAFEDEEEAQEESVFELLVLDDAVGGDEVNPDLLTYQRALEAIYEMDPAIVGQAEIVKKKRDALTSMIGSHFIEKEGMWVGLPEPGYTMGEYEAAKLEYERERDLLRKLKAESSALYGKE